MHFSTIAVSLALAGSSMAELARRQPMPYMPRALMSRQDNNGCGGAQFSAGMTCCGNDGQNYILCAQGYSCTNGDNIFWCCPVDNQNCAKPAGNACDQNNGGCETDKYTCDSNNGAPVCAPKDAGAIFGGSSSTESASPSGTGTTEPATSTSESTSTSTAEAGGATTTSTTTTTTTTTTTNGTDTSGGASGAGSDNGSGSGSSSGTDTGTGSSTGNETTGGVAAPGPATAGASRVGGISALAIAVMAGVYFL